LDEANLILPQLTLVAMVPTFAKFGKKLIELVDLGRSGHDLFNFF